MPVKAIASILMRSNGVVRASSNEGKEDDIEHDAKGSQCLNSMEP